VALLEHDVHTVSLEHAAERLHQKSQETKEYSIIAETEKPSASFSLVGEGWIYGSEFDRALRLKAELTQKFAGLSLTQAIPGEAVDNKHGECYCISENHSIDFWTPTAEEARKQFLSELKLLPGIGPARAQTLKAQGYKTIKSLLSYPRWRQPAKDFMALLASGDVYGLQQYLRRSLPRSHQLSHYLAGFCEDKDFAVIDIETLGLFGRPIILIGLWEFVESGVCTRQFLARDVAEEAAVLAQFALHLRKESAFISFNGRCFDVPFMRERMAYYGLDGDSAFGGVHFDVLHFARRAFKDKLGSCRLESIEAYMGIGRGVNIPGALVPEFYDSYQRTGNVGPLVAIVEHNKQDLVTLAQLFCSLYKEWTI
jgi:uncharacterized protein YprB with RNaseH-like and TPR domain